MKYIILLISTIFNSYLFAQTDISMHGDFRTAIKIKDSTFGPTTPPVNEGNIVEFHNNKSGNTYFFEKEHHTVWYRIDIPKNANLLTLDIMPLNINDDYDFLIYKFNGSTNFANDIIEKRVIPIRSVLSRNDKRLKSKTGLRNAMKQTHIPSGINKSYASPLQVSQGEVYYMCVDNVYDNGSGHSILLHYKFCKGAKRLTQTRAIIRDKETNREIVSHIELWVNDVKKQEIDGKSIISIPLIQKVKTVCKAAAKGYITGTIKVDTTKFEQIILLEKITTGKKLTFNDFYFEPNSPVLLPTSFPVLSELKNMLKLNPEVMITINGHVNGFRNVNDPNYQTLSLNRAQTIKRFLVNYGIEETRMTCAGKGTSEMIYPNPRDENQAQRNRRVEIIIK